MLHCSWDMRHDGWNFNLSFWAIFCPFTLLRARKSKLKKNIKKKKKHLEISSVYTYTKKMITWCTVPEIWYGTRWTGSWTDGWKWHIEVGAPRKNPAIWLVATILAKNLWNKIFLKCRVWAGTQQVILIFITEQSQWKLITKFFFKLKKTYFWPISPIFKAKRFSQKLLLCNAQLYQGF